MIRAFPDLESGRAEVAQWASLGCRAKMNDLAQEASEQRMLNGNGANDASVSEPIPSVANLSIAPEVIRLLPADFDKRNRILPVERQNGSIRIATAEPGNQQVIEDIRLFTGLEVDEWEVP